MSNNERTYRNDINNENNYYKVTIKQFKEELTNWELELFAKALRDPDLDVFDIACDFSIPVCMIKYFKRVGF